MDILQLVSFEEKRIDNCQSQKWWKMCSVRFRRKNIHLSRYISNTDLPKRILAWYWTSQWTLMMSKGQHGWEYVWLEGMPEKHIVVTCRDRNSPLDYDMLRERNIHSIIFETDCANCELTQDDWRNRRLSQLQSGLVGVHPT